MQRGSLGPATAPGSDCATARVQCGPSTKGSRQVSLTHNRALRHQHLTFETPAPACSFQTENKSSRAGESWKQLTACSRPSPHTLSCDCSRQNQYSSIMDSAISCERVPILPTGREVGERAWQLQERMLSTHRTLSKPGRQQP